MAEYDYQCEACEHVFAVECKMDDREKACSDPCPECGEKKVERVFLSAPSIADSVRIGVTRPDNGFKEMLNKIKEKHPEVKSRYL